MFGRVTITSGIGPHSSYYYYYYCYYYKTHLKWHWNREEMRKTSRRPSAAGRTWLVMSTGRSAHRTAQRKNSHKIAALKDAAGIQACLQAVEAPEKICGRCYCKHISLLQTFLA